MARTMTPAERERFRKIAARYNAVIYIFQNEAGELSYSMHAPRDVCSEMVGPETEGDDD